MWSAVFTKLGGWLLCSSCCKSLNICFQLRKALSQLQRISAGGGANGLICSSPAASRSAGTQTEFPAAMLEDYVVKNRKRILKLLGIVPPQGSGKLIFTCGFQDAGLGTVQGGPTELYSGKYFICCLIDLFLFLVWHLSSSIWNTSISGVKSCWTFL